ncbi:60S ribosomal protein L18a-like protein [Rosa chinensis]|uniref:60S ribosomal protein L18a-like protein n=1 Tax=Rosa chinensis TaxID=74649 RepID=UPI000D091AFA|nr:60S ribosomal protein L18a-like protein [Rosa chinensis]
MTEAPLPPLISNNNNTTGITLQDHNAGDHDKKEMVKLEVDGGGDSALVEARFSDGVYDKPLSCFGCGIGWFSFLLGFAFPPLWYYATVLYFGNYLKDPRERPGLAASAIAALICSVVLVVLLFSLFS